MSASPSGSSSPPVSAGPGSALSAAAICAPGSMPPVAKLEPLRKRPPELGAVDTREPVVGRARAAAEAASPPVGEPVVRPARWAAPARWRGVAGRRQRQEVRRRRAAEASTAVGTAPAAVAVLVLPAVQRAARAEPAGQMAEAGSAVAAPPRAALWEAAVPVPVAPRLAA
ncbi:MAG TPA: hypothetical protein VHU40_17790 [Polyangia bacterium]|nr:hypothetical protein [Polyangia bacterium]